MTLMGLPVSFDGRRPTLRLGPPRHGEHTRVIGDGRRSPRRVIPGFNDRCQHRDIMAMFDLALESV